MHTKFILASLGALLVFGMGLLLVYQERAPQPIACSMEAKLCPDGSAVGRSGPHCEFSECPAVTATSSPEVPAILPYGTVTLRINETATFDGLTLTLLRVSDDSRCGEGVTCIWAGTLHAGLRISSGLGVSTPTIELGKFVTTEAEIISLLSASPYPKAGMTILPEEYALTFSVLKRDAMTPY